MGYDWLRRSVVRTVLLYKSYDGLGRDFYYYAPALSLSALNELNFLSDTIRHQTSHRTYFVQHWSNHQGHPTNANALTKIPADETDHNDLW